MILGPKYVKLGENINAWVLYLNGYYINELSCSRSQHSKWYSKGSSLTFMFLSTHKHACTHTHTHLVWSLRRVGSLTDRSDPIKIILNKKGVWKPSRLMITCPIVQKTAITEILIYASWQCTRCWCNLQHKSLLSILKWTHQNHYCPIFL